MLLLELRPGVRRRAARFCSRVVPGERRSRETRDPCTQAKRLRAVPRLRGGRREACGYGSPLARGRRNGGSARTHEKSPRRFPVGASAHFPIVPKVYPFRVTCQVTFCVRSAKIWLALGWPRRATKMRVPVNNRRNTDRVRTLRILLQPKRMRFSVHAGVRWPARLRSLDPLNEASHAHVAAALDTPMLATLLGLQVISPRSVQWRRARALHHLSGRPR